MPAMTDNQSERARRVFESRLARANGWHGMIIYDNDVRADLIRRIWSPSFLVKSLGRHMIGFQAKLERYESLAAECELIAERSDGSNREFYLRACEHYRELANDLRTLIASFDVAA